jgi:hypothetical protein
MQHLIVAAIKNRQVLILHYAGTKITVEPHAYGHDARGEAMLLCYQVDTARHASQGWRTLAPQRADAILAAGRSFAGARPGYRRGHADVCAPLAAL